MIKPEDKKWTDALADLSKELSGSEIIALFFVDRATGEVDAKQTLTSFFSLWGIKKDVTL